MRLSFQSQQVTTTTRGSPNQAGKCWAVIYNYSDGTDLENSKIVGSSSTTCRIMLLNELVPEFFNAEEVNKYIDMVYAGSLPPCHLSSSAGKGLTNDQSLT